ncbi:sensor histidine kinase [Actinomadura rifamycini]|uniref:sensor histidine kinase n=1 Tax=Actinomadura rifamycini TaxID=31962 RepID=UPI00041AE58A|nr:ATP-binding protein [Actinomadura rifamycini]
MTGLPAPRPDDGTTADAPKNAPTNDTTEDGTTKNGTGNDATTADTTESADAAAGGDERAAEARTSEGFGPPVVLPEAEYPEPHGLSRVSLRNLYRTGSLVLALLLAGAFALAGAALYQNDGAREELVRQVSQATLEQFEVTSSLNAQDTAIRSFAKDGGAEALAEFRAAVERETAAAARMRRLLAGVSGGEEVVALLDRTEADAAAWRAAFAEPMIARGAGTGLTEEQDDRGRRLYDTVRGGVQRLQGAITTLHEDAADRLEARGRATLWGTGFALGLVAAAVIAMAVLIRRTVLKPVSSMTDRVRAVAQGDFAHPLDVSGPAELHELAAIIDAMRRRIIDEWGASVRAAGQLTEQAEELRRSNAELEQFAYVASHDLQEPLRKVASFCQMIERRYGDQLDDRGRQYIEFAVDGAKRMQALINDLLQFSRVGRMSRIEDAVDLNEVARQAVSNLDALIEETGATVDVGELPAVPGDRSQLTQLFQNLVGNAIKFRREGVAPRVALGAARRDGEWEFHCSDNGIGIEPRYADRIFLIFQRLHQRDEYSGTGIGLALCKKIVEYHGGRIWLAAEEPDTEEPDTEETDTEEPAGAERGDGETGTDAGTDADTAPGSGTTFRWTLPERETDDRRHD